MTTYDRTITQSAAGAVSMPSALYSRPVITVETIIDFSATGNAYSAGDTFKLIQVPPGYVLEETGLEVLLADTAGNSGTVQLELGASTRGSAVTVASLGFSSSAFNATVAAASGSIAYVQAVTATGTVNAVVRFWASLRDVRAKTGTPVVIGGGAGNYVSPTFNYTGTSALTYVT